MSVCVFVCPHPPLSVTEPQNCVLRPPPSVRFCWPEANNNQVVNKQMCHFKQSLLKGYIKKP